MKKECCQGHSLSYWLLIIGGLNWGLVGLFEFDLVERLLGSVSWLQRAVYVLVGLSAIMMLMKSSCKKCKV